jgi:predicted DNA-binding transcriptional regulator
MLVQLFIVFVADVLPYSHIIHIDSEVHVSKDDFNLVIEDRIVKVRCTSVFDKGISEYFSDLLRTFFVVHNICTTFKVAIDEAE